ncbi:hypothetical protein [Methanoregula sp. UBA64]|jgi:hypothetical protein|uniref:hypothetical protein n=1 Tax=Methanoregula sp. UBA64 TaxID=1915554 RepID=UPI0025E9536C|nr:hypothetical protein [Methanoregula sp. UBA64]
MIPLKKIGLVAAVLLVAALVCVPGVAAAGPGQGMPGNGQGSSGNQGQQGGFSQGPDNNQGSPNQQGNGQGANPRSGGQMGNTTQRQGQPPGTFGNMTGNQTGPGPMVLGNMTSFGPGERFGPGNTTFCTATGDNTTACQPFSGNATQAWGNETRQHQYGDNSTWQFQHQVRAENGNNTGSAPAMNGNSADKGFGQGQGSGQNSAQNQKDADLISAFLAWLNGGK